MKCYNLEYDLSKRSGKTVYVSQNSTFQIGIKCKYGDAYPVVELCKGAEMLEPEGTIGSYRTWQLASGEAEAEDFYEAECMGVRLPLKVVTTCSTVAELPAGDVDLSKYLTKSEAEYTYAKSEDVNARFTSLETLAMAADDKANAALSQVTVATQIANEAINLGTQANTNIGKMNDDSNVVVFSGTYEDGSEFSFKVPGAV